MNAVGPTETAIWVAVFAGEAVWSRRAADTTNMRTAYQAAENAVEGFRVCDEVSKASVAAATVAAAREAVLEEATRPAPRNGEQQKGQRR